MIHLLRRAKRRWKSNYPFSSQLDRTQSAELAVEISWGDDPDSGLWTGRITTLTTESDREPLSDEDSAEDYGKFQVLQSCNRVLGAQLIDETQEPKQWEALSKLPVEASNKIQKVYRGIPGLPVETHEDWIRLGTEGVLLMVS
jgi:hypothetical protein